MAFGQKSYVIDENQPLSDNHQLLILVPAMNEEAVIEQTMRSFLKETRGLDMIKMVIIDDASDDQTATVASNFIAQHGQEKLQLLKRTFPEAQTGKGEALNWAYNQLVHEGAIDSQHTIIGVLDADAYMEKASYRKVVQYFVADEKLDLLQIRVGMLETRNWLQLMQDVEFTVVNDWIQNTRNRIGNAAASGNGQFIRVSAVDNDHPWGNALLEDFEFSTRFLLRGRQTRYASDAVVYQEAIDTAKPFVRQRSRWTQGGLDCLVGYWAKIIKSPMLKLAAKIEMSFYMLIPFITIFTGAASIAVFVFAVDHGAEYWRLLVFLIAVNTFFSGYIILKYWQMTSSRQYLLLIWTTITFALYNYLLYPAIIIAFYRKLRGQTRWAKTVHGIKKVSNSKRETIWKNGN